MKCWESEHFVLTLRLCSFAWDQQCWQRPVTEEMSSGWQSENIPFPPFSHRFTIPGRSSCWAAQRLNTRGALGWILGWGSAGASPSQGGLPRCVGWRVTAGGSRQGSGSRMWAGAAC